jgi:hypothetical protein
MIEPSATEVLRGLTACFEEVIRPALTGTAERSAAATMSGLLRHLRLRLEKESAIAAADLARQAPLLARLAEGRRNGPAESWSLNDRQAAIEAALVQLIAARDAQGETEEYRALRAALRAEMAAQVRGEAALIEPAFAGSGPRR